MGPFLEWFSQQHKTEGSIASCTPCLFFGSCSCVSCSCFFFVVAAVVAAAVDS